MRSRNSLLSFTCRFLTGIELLCPFMTMWHAICLKGWKNFLSLVKGHEYTLSMLLESVWFSHLFINSVLAGHFKFLQGLKEYVLGLHTWLIFMVKIKTCLKNLYVALSPNWDPCFENKKSNRDHLQVIIKKFDDLT